ncbi:MAG TPA: TolC family protein [Gemmataceae bacterium]|nr:TolC family protein [Gemmataceae bacterium]
MRATESKPGGRRWRVWRTVAITALEVLSSSTGCRWNGLASHPDATHNPPPLPPVLERAVEPWRATAVNNVPSNAASAGIVQAAGEGSASDSGLILTSAPANAAAAPPAEKAADSTTDDRDKRRKSAGSAAPYQVDRTLPSPAQGMVTPAIPAPEKVQPISLAAALFQAGVQNPIIAIARQAIRVSQAQLLQASVLLLPNINAGSSYDMNNGTLQGSTGVIRKVDRQALYYGLGAYAVVAGTVAIPGVWIDVPLTDALFEPLAARHVVANRRAAAQATNNQVLLDVSTAYIALLGAEGRLAVIRQSEADFQEVARLTAAWAKPGIALLRDADANRAAADLKQLQFQEQKAQEDVAVAAADLSRLLNLDPSVRLQTGDVPIQIVQFVDPKEPLPKLLEIATRNRPELTAAAATIRASQIHVRQETFRPLIPLLWAGLSAGDFGGGAVAIQNPVGVPASSLTDGAGQPGGRTSPTFGNFAGRLDIDVMALWTLQNMGLGNLAHVKQRRAELGQAQAARLAVLNQVALEVSEAYNRSAEAFRSILIERRNVQEATEGFQRDLKSILGGIALPIEVLDNCERLRAAREALLAALIGFDRAQFQLFVALGQPPTLVVQEEKPPAPPPVELPVVELPPPQAVPPEKK